MQVCRLKRRVRAFYYLGLIVWIFSGSVYASCCTSTYKKEWRQIGEYMKKFYIEAAESVTQTKALLRDTGVLYQMRGNGLMPAISYQKVFEASEEVENEVYDEYLSLYVTKTGPVVWNVVENGGEIIDALTSPPKINVGLVDYVVRSHRGGEYEGELYGHQHLLKREIEYVQKGYLQECANDEIKLKQLEADIFVLELALAKLSKLSNDVIAEANHYNSKER